RHPDPAAVHPRRSRGRRTVLHPHPQSLPLPGARRRPCRGHSHRSAVDAGLGTDETQRGHEQDPGEGPALVRLGEPSGAHPGRQRQGRHRPALLDPPLAAEASRSAVEDLRPALAPRMTARWSDSATSAHDTASAGPAASLHHPDRTTPTRSSMGFFDALLDRTKPKRANLDDLFALPPAALTLQAATGFTPTGVGAVAFRQVEGAAFQSAESESVALI